MRLDIQKIILALLNGNRELDSSVPELLQPVVKRIVDEQIQGVIYRQLKNLGVIFPLAQALENVYCAGLVLNTYMIKAVEELENKLSERKISILLIKGMALINRIYPDPGMRPMEDIDAVIIPENRALVERILISCGYKQKQGYPLMFERNGVSIDLHTDLLHTDRIQNRKYLNPLDLNQVFKNSLPWVEGFSYVRRPDDADHLIFLCHHMIKHSFSKLIWLVDVYRILVHMEASVWQALSDRLSTIYEKRPLFYVLYLLENMFNYRPPGDSGFAGYQRYLSLVEKRILDLRSFGQSVGDLGNVLWMFCLPGFKERLRYGLETLFPKKDVLLREQGMNRNRTVSIYANRLSMLLRSFLNNFKIILGTFLRRSSS